MATKGKQARKTTVKVSQISKSDKQLGKGDMKKIKGGHNLTKELTGTLVHSAPKSKRP